MRYINLMIVGFIIVLLSACKGGDALSPVSEKIQGSLGEYFEVVSKDYKAKDGRVSIEIKRIKEGFPSPWKEGMEVGYSDGQFEPQFTVEFQDADGNVVSKDKTDIVISKDELNSFSNLGIDESATITFHCMEGISQFKIGSAFEYHGEVEKTVNLEGGIGKYPIMMTMHIAADGEVTGAYYYKKMGPGNYLYIKGEKSKDHITLNEFTKDGEQTGTYKGTYKDDVFTGSFNTRSGNYEFVLNLTDMENIDFSNIDFDSFYAEHKTYDTGGDGSFSSASSGSGDWDALLDSYDSYVTQYISLMKKANNGDMDALAEYPTFLQKAQDLSNKMEGAQGEMSASQWARYMKINNKMLEAAQQMR